MEPTSTLSSSESRVATPLARQVQALKQQHPDTIVFFRLGDFYEVFDEDARLVARELHVTLTSRPLGPGQRAPMAGVPAHSIDQWIAHLIAKGHKVAVAEQLAQANDSSPDGEVGEPAGDTAQASPAPNLAEDPQEVDGSSAPDGEELEGEDDEDEEPAEQTEPAALTPPGSQPEESTGATSAASPPSTGESEAEEPRVEQEPHRRELKLVLRLKPAPGGYRAALSVSTPETDVVSAISHVDGIAGALAAVPTLIAQAEQLWASTPRYPVVKSTKATAEERPPAPVPVTEAGPAAPSPQLSLF